MRSHHRSDTHGAPEASLPWGYPRRREARCVWLVSSKLRAACREEGRDTVLRDATYSIVNRGETTAPYCAAFAPLGSVPLVLGEMVSVQMPHQHRILWMLRRGGGEFIIGRPTFIRIWLENALAKVGRVTGPLPQTNLRTKERRQRLSTCRCHRRGKIGRKGVSRAP
jgi:hypothetical protein